MSNTTSFLVNAIHSLQKDKKNKINQFTNHDRIQNLEQLHVFYNIMGLHYPLMMIKKEYLEKQPKTFTSERHKNN